MKRGEILLNALNLIYDGAMAQADFFAAVLSAGYGASMSKIDHEYQKNRRFSKLNKPKKEEIEKRKRRLGIFISKMKHQGFIQESNGKFSISKQGKQKLNKLKSALPGRHYEKIKIPNPIIISFDIPEKMRGKRSWLREVIKNLEFKMIHQSVWIGHTKIPRDFILDLENMKILEFIEIFKINKRGSLQKLI